MYAIHAEQDQGGARQKIEQWQEQEQRQVMLYMGDMYWIVCRATTGILCGLVDGEGTDIAGIPIFLS